MEGKDVLGFWGLGFKVNCLVVCYFYPAGNVQGQFERNIPKTSGEADDERLISGYGPGLTDPSPKLDQSKSNLTD